MDSKPTENTIETKTISPEEEQFNILVLQLLGFDAIEKSLLKQQIAPYLLAQKLKPRIWKEEAWQKRTMNEQQSFRSYFADFIAQTSENKLVLCSILPISDSAERDEYEKTLNAEKKYLSYYISEDFLLLINEYFGPSEIEPEPEENSFTDPLIYQKQFSVLEIIGRKLTIGPSDLYQKKFFKQYENDVTSSPQDSQIKISEEQRPGIEKRINLAINSDLTGITFSRCLDGRCTLDVVINGEIGSVYEGGKFNLEYTLIDVLKPPIVRFKTRVYHPNINSQGQICMDLLNRQYSPTLTPDKMVLCIQSLLTDPNPENPLVPSIGALYLSDREKYNQKCREWTKLYAMN